MNIHHLELFFYVARHGGITQGVRNIPYGIQQPAVSAQVIRLEQHLGLTLFQRRPFQLTPAGQELYEFIRPFFENLYQVGETLRGGQIHLLRLAASTVVLRQHFPALLRTLVQENPQVRLVLREGLQPQMEQWLLKDEIDLAVTVLEERPAAGLWSVSLIELPLALITGPGHRLKSTEELWKQDRIRQPLVCLPPAEPISLQFQRTLADRKIEWPPAIEVSSLDLVETYVSHGFGVGLTVEVPEGRLPGGVRKLRLAGFPPIVVGALWRGRLGKVAQVFLDALQAKAAVLRQILATSHAATSGTGMG